MSDRLTQEEIDAMLNGGVSKKEEGAVSELDEKDKFDIIGEVGNISMSQAATTLSSILNRRVKITTPKVSKIKFADILVGLTAPKVATTVEFNEGLFGSNLMLLEVDDAVIIADLMMGGDGNPKSKKFTELELSAVAEAMNQMIGSASTSMATMINRKVDILPPVVDLWENQESITYDKIVSEDEIYCISFSLSVEGLIESEIMQVFTEPVVEDIAQAMLSDKAQSIRKPDEESSIVEEIEEKEPITEQNPQSRLEKTTDKKTSVSSAEFQPLDPGPFSEGDNLDLILDVPLDLSVVLGKSRKSIKEILTLNTGSVIELDKLTDEPLEILVNGKLIATGEVVVINENFGVRITNILSQKQRLSHLH